MRFFIVDKERNLLEGSKTETPQYVILPFRAVLFVPEREDG